ncbi:hypothetical protein EJ02DRAFT_487754 [Clathrospora elynae]|uniref:Uncharacterized protein n=1 Tax=Clathrospora elynae TaxID=706981 RepID=A0A6A5S2T8_9PLEO|nr:hypothetical protein EJ02DRAFT_487754 [Clathrospora elynae]
MVACTACLKSGQACRMLSLSARCGNCYQSRIATCVLVHIPVPDFLSINWEIEKLSEEEEAAELQLDADQAATDALVWTQAARAKLQRLWKQKRLLKQKEQEIFDKGWDNAEALEQLEQLELFNQEMALANPDALANAHVVDWSAFWTGGDVLDGTLPEVGGSLSGWCLVPKCSPCLGILTI